METTQDKLAYWRLRERDAERALSVARRQIMNYTTELLDEPYVPNEGLDEGLVNITDRGDWVEA